MIGETSHSPENQPPPLFFHNCTILMLRASVAFRTIFRKPASGYVSQLPPARVPRHCYTNVWEAHTNLREEAGVTDARYHHADTVYDGSGNNSDPTMPANYSPADATASPSPTGSEFHALRWLQTNGILPDEVAAANLESHGLARMQPQQEAILREATEATMAEEKHEEIMQWTMGSGVPYYTGNRATLGHVPKWIALGSWRK
jgi:hypothetical protein